MMKLAEIMGKSALQLKYRSTERNEPMTRFLADPAFTKSSEEINMNVPAFTLEHSKVLAMFQIEEILA
jgi:hypothetical protein